MAYISCPSCGFANAPGRTICKSCRNPLNPTTPIANRTLESFEQHIFMKVRSARDKSIVIIGFVCLLCLFCGLNSSPRNRYNGNADSLGIYIAFIIGFLVFILLFYASSKHKSSRASISQSVILDVIKNVLENRSRIKKSTINSALSNERYNLAINEKNLQEKLMLLAESIYLNPWNEEALFLFPLSIAGGGNNISLLAAEIIQECGGLWNASLLRYSYQYSNFSAIAKTTPSSENLPTIQKWARSLVEEGKKILGFSQAETEGNKKLLLDIVLQLATAYAVLENKIMVNEMINRAIAKEPSRKLDFEDKRGELLHLAEGELRRLVAIKDLQNAINEEVAYNALRSSGRGIRKELDAPNSPFKRD